MVEKNQRMRYTKQECGVIADAFKDNEEVLYALRKFFWQLDLSEKEWIMLKKTVSPEFIGILKKDFIGGIEYELPLGMTFDPLIFAEVTKMTPDDVYAISEAKVRAVEYFKQQIEELETDKKGTLNLIDLKPKRGQDKFQRYVDLYAYSTIVSFVEKQLMDYNTLAYKPAEETDQEKADRRTKDSSK